MLVPEVRIVARNERPVRAGGDFVLYWMISSRRIAWNFAIQRALEWANELRQPLLVFEALRCDYPWASDRLHRFVIEGMADNARALIGTGIGYYPYVEPKPDDGKRLLEVLAAHAGVVVTDDFPAFFLPSPVSAAAERLPVSLEQADSNGLLPMRETDKAFSTAHSFRRFLQMTLTAQLDQFPAPDPLAHLSIPPFQGLPPEVVDRWSPASPRLLDGHEAELASLDVDHKVRPVDLRGGTSAAAERLRDFVVDKLPSYAEARNDPSENRTSGLSPYLHFGHISAHQVFAEVMHAEGWTRDRLAADANGRRHGWWGVSSSAEAFLDQLITWRELGFNFCHLRSDYDTFDSLPDWARLTLRTHASDARQHLYSTEELESATTHDPVWNAAQRQLLREGRIHNYLRMLWGKKILEWTVSPQDALNTMVHLNNKYALDGRDPNSYSGIFWCLGRYDRPWGPERPVFGKVRYMSSENTRRKLNLKPYLEKYGNKIS